MSHAKRGCPRCSIYRGGTAEAANQEIAQALLGALEIARWIHRTENVVAGNLPVERRNQAGEAFFTDRLENL